MKKITLCIILCFVLLSCKTQSNIITSKKEAISKGIYSYDENQNVVISTASKSNKTYTNSSKSLPFNLVNTAKQNLGTAYKAGGTTKDGMDCSGLVFTTFDAYKITLPRTSVKMADEGNEVSIRNAQPGDLIFFKTNNSRDINHVGIITNITNSDIIFIHSSTSKGVIESSLNEKYYQDAYEKINRIIE